MATYVRLKKDSTLCKCNFVIFPIPENVRGSIITITKEGECYSLQDPADHQIQTLMAYVELSVRFRSVEQETPVF